MEVGRTGGEFAEGNNSITDVGAASDIGVEELAKKTAVGKTVLRNQGLMFD